VLGVLPDCCPDEVELASDAELEGGVNRCPTLAFPGAACGMFVERGGNRCGNCKFEGGGSSKLPRRELAPRLAVKLEGALSASNALPM